MDDYYDRYIKDKYTQYTYTPPAYTPPPTYLTQYTPPTTPFVYNPYQFQTYNPYMLPSTQDSKFQESVNKYTGLEAGQIIKQGYTKPTYSIQKPENMYAKMLRNSTKAKQENMSDFYQRSVVQSRIQPPTSYATDDFYTRGVANRSISRNYLPAYLDDYYQRAIYEGKRTQGSVAEQMPGNIARVKAYPEGNLVDWYFRDKAFRSGEYVKPPTNGGGGGGGGGYVPPDYSYPSNYANTGGSRGKYPGGSYANNRPQNYGYGAQSKPQWVTGLFQLNANR